MLKSKCCPCNGKNARCKSCVCCKLKRTYFSCLHMKRSCCFNSNSNQSPTSPSAQASNSRPRTSCSPASIQPQANSSTTLQRSYIHPLRSDHHHGHIHYNRRLIQFLISYHLLPYLVWSVPPNPTIRVVLFLHSLL